MQNSLINVCEKFYDDFFRNDRALKNRKSDNNKNNNNNSNVLSHWGPVSGSNKTFICNSLTMSVEQCTEWKAVECGSTPK